MVFYSTSGVLTTFRLESIKLFEKISNYSETLFKVHIQYMFETKRATWSYLYSILDWKEICTARNKVCRRTLLTSASKKDDGLLVVLLDLMASIFSELLNWNKHANQNVWLHLQHACHRGSYCSGIAQTLGNMLLCINSSVQALGW